MNTCKVCKKKLTCAHCVGRRGGQMKGRKGFAVTGKAREAAKKRWALWKTVAVAVGQNTVAVHRVDRHGYIDLNPTIVKVANNAAQGRPAKEDGP